MVTWSLINKETALTLTPLCSTALRSFATARVNEGGYVSRTITSSFAAVMMSANFLRIAWSPLTVQATSCSAVRPSW